jgi:hypothetical protein
MIRAAFEASRVMHYLPPRDSEMRRSGYLTQLAGDLPMMFGTGCSSAHHQVPKCFGPQDQDDESSRREDGPERGFR